MATSASTGRRKFRTPHLDRMARQGARFTSFYVAAPVCTPSRAALLTGSHPVRVGLGRRVLFPYSNTGLHPGEITLAELLKEQGYATGIVGKWHLGHHRKFLPTRQGFDSYFGIPYSNDMGNHWYARENFMSPPTPMLRDERLIEQQPDQNLLTRRYTEEALRFIRGNKDRPFFLYLAHSMPHWPLAASARFRRPIGARHLRRRDRRKSTGPRARFSTSSKGLASTAALSSSSAPTMARRCVPGNEEAIGRARTARCARGKNTTWEGGMRVPGIMRWPGKIPEGLVQDEMATAMDISAHRRPASPAPGRRGTESSTARTSGR